MPCHLKDSAVTLSFNRIIILCMIKRQSLCTVFQVSFNHYDRAPMRLEADQEAKFYRSYHEFHQRLSNPSHWWQYRLGVGEALYFNNHRLLHGRLAYTGRRSFVGCYQNMEDFESRMRVLSDMNLPGYILRQWRMLFCYLSEYVLRIVSSEWVRSAYCGIRIAKYASFNAVWYQGFSLLGTGGEDRSTKNGVFWKMKWPVPHSSSCEKIRKNK